MAGKTISQLGPLVAVQGDDYFPIVDPHDQTQGPAGSTKRATMDDAFTDRTITDAVVAGDLTMSDAVSQIVPGATSFAVRDHADALDNLLIADNGDATVRGVLTGASVASPGSIISSASFISGRMVRGNSGTPTCGKSSGTAVVNTVAVVGNDVAGKITFNCTTAGSLTLTLTPNVVFPPNTVPVLQWGDPNGAALIVFPSAISPAAFDILFQTNPVIANGYILFYQVMG